MLLLHHGLHSCASIQAHIKIGECFLLVFWLFLICSFSKALLASTLLSSPRLYLRLKCRSNQGQMAGSFSPLKSFNWSFIFAMYCTFLTQSLTLGPLIYDSHMRAFLKVKTLVYVLRCCFMSQAKISASVVSLKILGLNFLGTIWAHVLNNSGGMRSLGHFFMDDNAGVWSNYHKNCWFLVTSWIAKPSRTIFDLLHWMQHTDLARRNCTGKVLFYFVYQLCLQHDI